MSRRTLLGVAGGAVVGAVVGASPSARAANGDPLIIGAENHGDTTYLFGDGSPVLVLSGTGDDGMLNVFNTDPGTGYAILAKGGHTSILAEGGENGIEAYGKDVGGIFGGDPASGVGVRARGKVGVLGISSGGVGVKAQSGKAGVALKVQGRSQFSTAGRSTIAQGDPSVTITSPVPLSETSLILATSQDDGGVIRSATKDIAGGTFTLTLVDPASRDLNVAWFVIG